MPLVLPGKVTVRLVDFGGNAFQLENVLFTITSFALRKNNFRLGPFASNRQGVIEFTKADLLAEASANYDTGVMDFDSIENCHPEVLIAAMSEKEVEGALYARANIWKSLLNGESQRWNSIDELRETYRTASNKLISAEPLQTRWDGERSEYEYSIRVTSNSDR